MSGDQWFQLWLAVVQAGVGAIVTVAAVFVAARLALRHQHRRTLEDRSRHAAERLSSALAVSAQAVMILHGTVVFVIQPQPASIKELEKYGVSVPNKVKDASSSYEAASAEIGFIDDEELTKRLGWVNLSLTELKLFAASVESNPDRCTIDDLIRITKGTANCLYGVQRSLLRYLKGQPLGGMSKPSHWDRRILEIEEGKYLGKTA